MTVKLKVDGLKGIDKAFAELPVATGKNAARRALRKAAQPFLKAARAKVPVDEGHLRDSLAVSSKLTRSQRRSKNRRRDTVELYAGAGGHAAGALNGVRRHRSACKAVGSSGVGRQQAANARRRDRGNVGRGS